MTMPDNNKVLELLDTVFSTIDEKCIFATNTDKDLVD